MVKTLTTAREASIRKGIRLGRFTRLSPVCAGYIEAMATEIDRLRERLSKTSCLCGCPTGRVGQPIKTHIETCDVRLNAEACHLIEPAPHPDALANYRYSSAVCLHGNRGQSRCYQCFPLQPDDAA